MEIVAELEFVEFVVVVVEEKAVVVVVIVVDVVELEDVFVHRLLEGK